MKIEKLNENQIRCTLTREDLASRKLKLSELAYGSEKAKALFREMMQQAAFEHGFEANDIPLMIEAIPVSTEALVLIITKMEDPEELDTRFAKFGPASSTDGSNLSGSLASMKFEGADDILNLFQKIREAHKNLTSGKTEESSQEAQTAAAQTEVLPIDVKKMYGFHDLNQIIRVSHLLKHIYHGANALYKDKAEDEYYLILSASDHTPEEFNKVCNILSEYGDVLKYTAGTESYFKEHGKAIIAQDALLKLSGI